MLQVEATASQRGCSSCLGYGLDTIKNEQLWRRLGVAVWGGKPRHLKVEMDAGWTSEFGCASRVPLGELEAHASPALGVAPLHLRLGCEAQMSRRSMPRQGTR